MGLIAKIEEKLSSNKSNEVNTQEVGTAHDRDSTHPTHISETHVRNATSTGPANTSPADGLSGHGSHAASNTTTAHSSNITNVHPAVRGDSRQTNESGATQGAASTGSNVLGGSEHTLLSSGGNVHSPGPSHSVIDDVPSANRAGTNTHGDTNATTGSHDRGSNVSDVGGLGRESDATIERSHNTGLSSGTGNHLGGTSGAHSASHSNAYAHDTTTQYDLTAHKSRDPQVKKENYDAIPEAGGLKVGSGPFEHDRSYEPVTSGHSHSHHSTTAGHSAVPSQGQSAHTTGQHAGIHDQSHTGIHPSHDKTHAQSHHATGLSHDEPPTGLDNNQSNLTGGSIGDNTLHSSTAGTHTSGIGHNGGISNGQNTNGHNVQRSARSGSTPTEYSLSMAQHQADQMMR